MSAPTSHTGRTATWRLDFICTGTAAADDGPRPEPPPLLTNTCDPVQLQYEVYRHLQPLLTTEDFTVWVSLPTGTGPGQGDAHTQWHTLATFTITRTNAEDPQP